MNKFLLVIKALCVCLCISALILMVGIANLDHISKMDLVIYTACGIIAIATFISFKAIGKIERQKEIINCIDANFLKERK
jgi:hypothetical protein